MPYPYSLNQQRNQKRPAPFGPGTSLFRYSDCNLKHPNVGTSGAVATMGDRLPGRLGPASKREPLISLLAQRERRTRECTQQGHMVNSAAGGAAHTVRDLTPI